MNRGFAVAQQQQWPLAIKYFRSAQQIVPDDAAVLFNLALATDKAGGRELAALAWYNAFLASTPDAKNAPQVRKRTTELDIAAEAQVQKLIETAVQAAAQLPAGQDSTQAHARIARAQAEAGDLPGAARSLVRVAQPSARAWPTAVVAAEQARAGRIDIARSMINDVGTGRAKAWAQAELAVAMAKRGDIAGALKLGEAITHPSEKSWALSRVVSLQARAGDIAGALVNVEKIGKSDDVSVAMVMAVAAGAAAKMGPQWTGKEPAALLAEAEAALGSMGDSPMKFDVLPHIVRARAEIGYVEESERMALSLPDGPGRYMALKAFAQVRGNIAGAETYRWTALAIEAEQALGAGDVGALAQAAQFQSPAASAIAIAAAVEARARLLRRYRQPE